MVIEHDAEVAKRIRVERQCVRIDGDPWKVDNLCCAWNWATAPHIARSDKAHRACRRFARYIRRRLDGLGMYRETESGRLTPMWK